MSRDSVNREGLTFEEWVCAAGYARFYENNPRWSVLPYTESYTSPAAGPNNQYHWAAVPTPARRHTVIHYPKKIREAWRNGEDPTEWRAAKELGTVRTKRDRPA